MPDDNTFHNDEPAPDPAVGSAEYWRLTASEQRRIAMASVGIGPSNTAAWTIQHRRYTESDHCPLDSW